LNAGIAAAAAPWVAFLDGDDTWAPARLRRVIDRLSTDPELDVLFTFVELHTSAGPAGRSPDADVARRSLALGSAVRPYRDGRHEWMPSTSAMVVRRDCLLRAGAIPRDYRIAADAWLFLAVVAHARGIALLDEPLTRLTLHEGNAWSGRDARTASVASQRRELFERLLRDVPAVAAAAGANLDGLASEFASRRDEFAIWEQVATGRRVAGLAAALRWHAGPSRPGRRGWMARLRLAAAAILPAAVFDSVRAGYHRSALHGAVHAKSTR
jgi:hypothetical protein